MTVDQILSLGPALAAFLDEFADCFGRSKPRPHLGHYIPRAAQQSATQECRTDGLVQQHRSPHPARVSRQRCLGSSAGLQQIVARDHEDPKAIGIIDDSGHAKSGKMTPGVQWQYCGRLGKTANCVVTVQLAFSSFDTCYRTLPTPLLERRTPALSPGRHSRHRRLSSQAQHRLGTSRSCPGQRRPSQIVRPTSGTPRSLILAGLEQRHYRYVVEIPEFAGLPLQPRRQPALSGTLRRGTLPAGQADDKSKMAFLHQHTDKGPMVWKVKSTPFWLSRGA